jgi:hypothetical protein
MNEAMDSSTSAFQRLGSREVFISRLLVSLGFEVLFPRPK